MTTHAGYHRRILLIAVATSTLAAHGKPPATAPAAPLRIEPIPGQAESGTIEVHGVAAGAFAPAWWEAGTLHFQPDVRSPLLRPRLAGVFRNIYAPSAVPVPDGWRVFYGAWDGVPSGNDRIYSVFTRDFLDFGEPRTEIEHGAFIHVCNVNVMRDGDGSFQMMCTAYPDEKGLNKPAYFSSPDGKAWNGVAAPYPAKKSDIVEIRGYPPYRDADINGVNVLLCEDGKYRLYFCNWKDSGKVHRAAGTDGRTYDYEGPCLASHHGVNDVKKIASPEGPWYVMGLHMNTDRLWYALSRDGMRFGPERECAASLGAQDRYIVAIGWVADDSRILGFLYGAGAAPSLDRNRIFARWLQKRVVLSDADGRRIEPTGSLGPDRQVLSLGNIGEFDAKWQVFAEDGKTRLGNEIPMRAVSGGVYRVVWPR